MGVQNDCYIAHFIKGIKLAFNSFIVMCLNVKNFFLCSGKTMHDVISQLFIFPLQCKICMLADFQIFLIHILIFDVILQYKDFSLSILHCMSVFFYTCILFMTLCSTV